MQLSRGSPISSNSSQRNNLALYEMGESAHAYIPGQTSLLYTFTAAVKELNSVKCVPMTIHLC